MVFDIPDRVADFEPKEALPDLKYPVRDLENFNPDVQALGPPFVVSTFISYGIRGEEGLNNLESRIRGRVKSTHSGKFNKTDVLYSPIAPPPGAWDYRCRNCRFFNKNAGEDGGGTCDITGVEDDPFGGVNINPDAWCAYWMPLDGTAYLTYLKNRAEGADL